MDNGNDPLAELKAYALTKDQLHEQLGTSEAGLSSKEAQARLARYGPNEIAEVKGRPAILRFLENFYNLFAIMLWVGGILSFVGQMPQLGWAIFAVIVINAVFSFWQEFKAEKATEALKQLMPKKARVMRDGQPQEILAAELVPGDVILLEEGDNVSADARLVTEANIRLNNATLTGESEPVRKSATPHDDANLTLVEMPNLVFAGTSVAYGNGRAVVFATGMNTQFGKIASLTQSVQTELSPLQKEMEKIVRLVAILATSLGVVFFLLGYYVAHMPLIMGFVFAVGIIVANVPEGLLPTVTLALAMGVQRMAKRNALIKKLSSVETLGSTTVICTDKTGTLTKNEMTVKYAWAGGTAYEVTGGGYEPTGDFMVGSKRVTLVEDPLVADLVEAAVLCNNARLRPPTESSPGWTIIGDPTEAALIVAGTKAGFDVDDEQGAYRRLCELPFDSVRKRMTTVNLADGKSSAFVKGAPKEILDLCTTIRTPSGSESLSKSWYDNVISQNDAYARDGLRVLAMARRSVDRASEDYCVEDVERELEFVGLMAMMDPPREEVADAVVQCRTAGIRIIMITGDYGLTAESIARRIGIVAAQNARIITGIELDTMPEDELKEALEAGDLLFARVAPEHKMLIAQTLKSMGHVVAMTGDGVNDAPALKTADIGVAMGIAGTDVAKEAADMILTDDNFASIVHAVEEGRAVYDNIRRFVTYIFTSNIPEIVPFIAFVVFKIPLALTVMQILAIDLGTDLLPALALGTEAPEPGIMQRPPRPRNQRLLSGRILARAYLYLGGLQAAACMSAFFFMYLTNGWTWGLPMAATGLLYMKATTMTHGAVVTTQIGNAFAQRTNRESVFKAGLFTNKLLLWGILVELVVICILIYVQPFQTIFNHAPIGLKDWAYLAALAPTLLVADEIRKFFVRRRHPLPGAEATAQGEAGA